MNLKSVFINSLFIILFGILIFYLDKMEFKDAYSIVLIFTCSIIKTGFFILTGFKKIVSFTRINLTYYKFLVFICVNVLLIVLSFSVDFLCLFQVDHKAFSGVAIDTTIYIKLFKLFYFSLLIFANIGIANIMPESMAAQALTM